MSLRAAEADTEPGDMLPNATVNYGNEIPEVSPKDTLLKGALSVPGTRSGFERSTVLPRELHVSPALAVGARDRFEEVSTLGRGGIGEVALAVDHDIDRQVAVKRLATPVAPSVLARFIEEIRIVGQLEHPNIVPVHDVGVDAEGRYYFVMKHLQGESLETIIKKLRAGDRAAHARFTFPERGHIVHAVLNALAYAHQRGFVHRDLKPANVMIGPLGEVTIVDWGLAKRVHGGRSPDVACATAQTAATRVPVSEIDTLSPHSTIDGAVMGTPAYMAPEQARGEHSKCDERTDLYAVGILFYELLHLEHPLDAYLTTNVAKVLEAVQTVPAKLHDPSGASTHQPFVPSEFDWFLKTALAKAPAERFQSAEAMNAHLRRVLEGTFPVQCQRTFAKRALNTGADIVDRWPKTFIVGSTALLVAALAGAMSTVFRWLT